MEIGVPGKHGVPVLKHVELAADWEPANATILLQWMEVPIVLVIELTKITVTIIRAQHWLYQVVYKV